MRVGQPRPNAHASTPSLGSRPRSVLHLCRLRQHDIHDERFSDRQPHRAERARPESGARRRSRVSRVQRNGGQGSVASLHRRALRRRLEQGAVRDPELLVVRRLSVPLGSERRLGGRRVLHHRMRPGKRLGVPGALHLRGAGVLERSAQCLRANLRRGQTHVLRHRAARSHLQHAHCAPGSRWSFLCTGRGRLPNGFRRPLEDAKRRIVDEDLRNRAADEWRRRPFGHHERRGVLHARRRPAPALRRLERDEGDV